MTGVEVRRATASDRDAVWPLARDFATSFVPERSAFEISFVELLSRDDSVVLVAESTELGVIGYLLASVHLTFLANGPVGWVEEVMVDERARRRGVGADLMAAAETWSAERGAAYLSLASRRAGPFYAALGYEDSATFFKKNLAPSRPQ